MMNEQNLWERVLAFHGHECGGLMIGYKAALYAMELVGGSFSEDEDIVCISENDACCVDAIQALLGCTIGKGNLLFHMTGKMAFSFYNRTSGLSFRLLLRPLPEEMQEMSKEQSLEYYRSHTPQELFAVMNTRIALPEKARIFDSYVCECCGEKTGSNWIRLREGKKLCIDCYENYDRFHV